MQKQTKFPTSLAVGLGLVLVMCLGICGSCIPWGGLALKTEPWHEPAAKGDWPTMKKLLDQGMPVDAEDQNGDTALYYAVSHNHIDFAQKLVDRGADLFHRNHRNNEPLDVESVTNDQRTLAWVRKTLDKAQAKRK